VLSFFLLLTTALAEEPAPATPGPAPELTLSLVMEGDTLRAYQGSSLLDAEELADLVGDTATHRAYHRAATPTVLLGAGLAGSAGLALMTAWAINGDGPLSPPLTPSEQRWISGLVSYGVVVGPGSLLWLAHRKSQLNRVDRWYAPEEARRWVDAYNAEASGDTP
jgi:hypothetical protein